MHLLLLLAMASLQDPDLSSVAKVMSDPDTQAIGEAASAWDRCLDEGIAKYEPSGEPADAVAVASLWSCQAQFSALFEARVAARLSAAPNSDERLLRQELLAENPRLILGREWRLTHDVVVLRLARQP